MMPIRFVLAFAVTISIASWAAEASLGADDLLLEDYEGGGEFEPADWANSFEDSEGNANSAKDAGKVAEVQWATKWSGLPSTGPTQDLSRFKMFQIDVMVEKGEPVEAGSNFYFQLQNETNEGYSYWEIYVPQTRVPADGKWYRVQFPLNRMDTGHGDGGEAPTDFKSIMGTVCGMTFDEEDNKFKFKKANFDNVKVTEEEITETKVEPVAK